MIKHEGLSQASGEAEIVSKKTRTDQFVIKSLDGGLHYYVTPSTESIRPKDKVLAHYKDGNKIK